MPLQDKSEDEIKSLESQLIAKLQSLHGYSGNITLQRELHWPDDQYWPVRDRLVDRGVLTLQRARGGAVRLVATDSQIDSSPERENTESTERESDLYVPVATVLRGDWAKHFRLKQFLVEITAAQGRRNTGGVWSRPDIVVATMRQFQFLPGKFFDLVSFEIKPRWSIEVTAVYEALAHRRAATQAYVWFHCPNSDQDTRRVDLDRIAEEAERHGVGMYVASDPSDFATWEPRVDAERIEPDPSYLDELVTSQFTNVAKDELRMWMR